MELTPRGGGNRLSEMLRYATGVDMITAITQAIVGDDPGVIEQKPYDGYWAEIILHADKGGVFRGIEINSLLNAEVVEMDLWVTPGDVVRGFEGANDAIGTVVLKFGSIQDMKLALANQQSWLKIQVQ